MHNMPKAGAIHRNNANMPPMDPKNSQNYRSMDSKKRIVSVYENGHNKLNNVRISR